MAKDGIKELIKNCPLTNFSEHEKLKDYIIEQLNTHPENALDQSYWILETMFENGSKYLVSKPELVFYLSYIEKCKLIFKSLFFEYLEKTKDIKLQVFARLVSNSMWIASGISTLLINQTNQSVISEYRIFYENYITLAYLNKHPELCEAYNDHFTINSYKIAKDYSESMTKDDKNLEELTKQYNSLIQKYGPSYAEDYGWMSRVETDAKKRKLETMFIESNLIKAYGALYKHACKFTHSSSYSVGYKPDYVFLIQFLFALIDLMRQEFNILLDNINMVTKNKEILRTFIEVITENIFQNFDHNKTH